MAELDTKSFGAMLRQHRLAADLSQEALAEKAGLSLRAISDLERGTRRAPYAVTVGMLADALALPADDRRLLERSVDRHRGPLHRSGPGAAVAALRTPAHLPPPPSPAIGRESEVEEVARLLRSQARFLTLTGPAGVGKTHLALTVAAEVAGGFVDGATFIDLTSVRDPAAVLPAIGAALGLGESGDGSALERLQTYLQDRVILLVLDNFEQVLPAALQIPELLAACPGLCVLMTSREAMHLRAEQTFHVPPLALADPVHLPPLVELERVPAVALFLERARAQAPGFALSPENGRTVLELCIGLDGLPLAIELAAARISVLSPRMILDRLSDRLTMLRWQAQDLPERQQSLRAAIAWSYELLQAEEQGLLRMLGAFAGGFSLDAAEAVAAATGLSGSVVLEGLASLVDKSLVLSEEQAGGERRFRLLESIREYALEELARQDDPRLVGQAHAEYYTALAERADPELRGRDQGVWLARLNTELENLRSALGWSFEHEHGELGLRLAVALAIPWGRRGRLREERSWLERGLAGAPQAPPTLRVLALGRLAATFMATGQGLEARPILEEALVLGRELEAGSVIVHSLANLGWLAIQAGDVGAARSLLAEAAGAAQQAGEDWWGMLARMTLGAAAIRSGQLDWAGELLAAALSAARDLDDELMSGDALILTARVHHGVGETERAVAALREALVICGRFGDASLLALAADGVLRLAAEETAQAGRAAALLGAYEALRPPGEMMFTTVVVGGLEDVQVRLRSALGQGAYDSTLAAGRLLTFGQTLALAHQLLLDVESGGVSRGEALAEPAGSEPLSAREQAVLQLMADGLSNRAIAHRLAVAERTAKAHVTSVFNKLGVTRRAQAVAVASRLGLLSPSGDA